MAFVQMYKSTDSNIGLTLSGTAGSLIAILNKVLLTGYTPVSITSLTQTSNIATATIATNTTLVTGNYIVISGATQPEYNGTFQITVVNSTTFTYTISGSPVTPATGTLLYAKAGLGWTSPFTSTNIAVYRSTNISSNKLYLKINENGITAGGQKEVVATGYETMVDYQTGTGQFPTTTQLANGGLIWTKSITADATARVWTIIGDDKTFYIQILNGSWTFLYGFGHLITFKAGDGYNTFIGGQRTANTVTPNEHTFGSAGNMQNLTATPGIYLARSYIQVGSSCPATNLSYGSCSSNTHASYFYAYGPWCSSASTGGSTGGAIWPNPVDYGYTFLPVLTAECVSPWGIRGKMPGVYHMWVSTNPLTQYDEVTNITNMPGVKLVALWVDAYNQYSAAIQGGKLFIDSNGPWI